jgi:putative phosphoribosyl transferase
MFHDRLFAGLLLAEKLKKYRNDPGVILAFPVEVILTKKIGHPINKEYAIGAASLTDYFIIPHQDVTEEYIQKELLRVRARLKEMYTKFMGNKEPENLEGKTVIVIDDGIATGNTLLSTINVLRKSNPRKIIIGVPVASKIIKRSR